MFQLDTTTRSSKSSSESWPLNRAAIRARTESTDNMRTPIVRISETDMRRRFNDGRYWERLQAGELRAEEWDSRHPSLPAANEPHCTRSLMLSYFDQNGIDVARVHQ